MIVAERVFRCRLIEKMEQNKEFANKLGLYDSSRFQYNSSQSGDNKKKR